MSIEPPVRRVALRTLLLASLLLLALVAPASASAPNLVTDGGFESPVTTFIEFRGGDSFGGWHVEGDSVDLVGGLWQNSEGAQSLDLNGADAGSVYQDVPTIPGHAYTVAFAYAGNPDSSCTPGLKEVQVAWNGQVQNTESIDTTGHDSSNMGWIERSYGSLAASSGNTTRLKFTSYQTPGACGPTLDAVRVTDQTPGTQPACASGPTCSWNLADDVFQNMTGIASNPLPDSLGDADVWSYRDGGDGARSLLPLYSASWYDRPGVSAFYQNGSFPFAAMNTTPSDIAGYNGESATAPSHKVIVHPSPTDPVIVEWTSPVDGTLSVSGGVADTDSADAGGLQPGDGIGWRVDLLTNDDAPITIEHGTQADGGSQAFADGTQDGARSLESVQVSRGDRLDFVVTADPSGAIPGNGNYWGDTTRLDVTVHETAATRVSPVVPHTGATPVSVSADDATVLGSVDPEGQLTTTEMDYWKTADPGHVYDVAGPSYPAGTSGDQAAVRFHLPSLAAGTTYAYQMRATGALTGTATGEVRTLTTSAPPAPPAPGPAQAPAGATIVPNTPTTRPMPNVVAPLRDVGVAEGAIENAGINAAFTLAYVHVSVPGAQAGDVVAQSPAAGTSVTSSPHQTASVRLSVFLPSGRCPKSAVQQLARMELHQAQLLLKRLGCTVSYDDRLSDVSHPLLDSLAWSAPSKVRAAVEVPRDPAQNDLVLMVRPTEQSALSFLPDRHLLADADENQRFAVTVLQHALPPLVQGVKLYVDASGVGGLDDTFTTGTRGSAEVSIKALRSGIVDVVAEAVGADGQAIYGSMSIPVEAHRYVFGDQIELLDGRVFKRVRSGNGLVWHCLLGPALANCDKPGLAGSRTRAGIASLPGWLAGFLGIFGYHQDDPALAPAAQAAAAQPTADQKVRAASAHGDTPGLTISGKVRTDAPTDPGKGSIDIHSDDPQNIVAAGSANIVAAGSHNIVAAGSHNIVAAGSHNLISTNGSIVAAGSGNIVAAGSGNIVAAGSHN